MITRNIVRTTGPRAASLLLLLGVVLCAGCNGWSSRGPEVVDVKARYTDLKDRRVAVVVAVSDHTAFNFPQAREQMTTEITRRIVANVPGSIVTDPREIIAWQDDNSYWGTRPPSQLVRQLGVERLILIEVGEYRTHEPGNKHQLRGVIAARVNIVEAESPDPDNFAASYTKTVMYPEPSVSKIGRIAEGEDKIERMTQIRFCEEVSGLFFDHKLVR